MPAGAPAIGAAGSAPVGRSSVYSAYPPANTTTAIISHNSPFKALLIAYLPNPTPWRLVYSGANAHIGGAAADVAAHRRVDVRIARILALRQQRAGAHDLAGLAVAALHHVQIKPGFLHRLAFRRGAHGFDGGDFLPTAAETGVMHERTGTPSRCTVQAPHMAMPQPNLVPVRPASSRKNHSSGMCGSPSKVSGCSFTVN